MSSIRCVTSRSLTRSSFTFAARTPELICFPVLFIIMSPSSSAFNAKCSSSKSTSSDILHTRFTQLLHTKTHTRTHNPTLLLLVFFFFFFFFFPLSVSQFLLRLDEEVFVVSLSSRLHSSLKIQQQRERGLIQNPATEGTMSYSKSIKRENDVLFKIQQEIERAKSYSKSSNRENEDLFKIQQESERESEGCIQNPATERTMSYSKSSKREREREAWPMLI